MEENKTALRKDYTSKVKTKDEKIIEFLHEIEKESGIIIFDKKVEELQNLNDLEVMMRLE